MSSTIVELPLQQTTSVKPSELTKNLTVGDATSETLTARQPPALETTVVTNRNPFLPQDLRDK